MKFKRRFAFVDQSAKKQERGLSSPSHLEMEGLWQEAKKKDRGCGSSNYCSSIHVQA
jgi:uncharacterized protein YabN with tetrapyrrole methylase and pyrophosphatase domain